MLDRPRSRQITYAALCLLAFAVLAVGVAQQWGLLIDVDSHGRGATRWAVDDHGLGPALRVVEVAFGTIAMTAYTVALAGLMLLKGHRRAALFTVAVMLACSLTNAGLKLLVRRDRPDWQSTGGFLESYAYPSGHASGIAAFAGVVMVLTLMLVRRGGIRRLITTLVVLLVLLVAADRVLLGRHFPTDVVGGTLLGVAFVLLGLVVLNPLPKSHAVKAVPLAEAVPSERQLAVVLNPIKVEDVDLFKALLTQMARESGWQDPTWYLTTPDDSGTGQAELASVSGADLVIVCGGDGTVREVAAELAGTGIPVGIVPAGTGNLLARNLDIPLFVRAAVDVALTGQDRAIDMVEVRGDGIPDSHFMVMAGMGFDAAIMEGVNEDIKKKVGWLAYVVSALKSLMFPPAKVEISIDDGPWTEHRARTIVVGNVGYLQAGMPLLPDATIDDGQLDVVLLYPKRFLSWLRIVYRVLAKRPRTDSTVNRMTGRTVSIRAAADTPRQLDGDSVGSGRELHATCIHGRLLVRVPR